MHVAFISTGGESFDFEEISTVGTRTVYPFQCSVA